MVPVTRYQPSSPVPTAHSRSRFPSHSAVLYSVTIGNRPGRLRAHARVCVCVRVGVIQLAFFFWVAIYALVATDATATASAIFSDCVLQGPQKAAFWEAVTTARVLRAMHQ